MAGSYNQIRQDTRGLLRHGPNWSPNISGGKDQRAWVEVTHPDYDAEYDQWIYALDHYSGAAGLPAQIEKYLIARRLGETAESYSERRDLADFTPHFGQLVDSLCGMLFQVENQANRVFGELDPTGTEKGLGRPQDRDSLMYELWRDANNQGDGWLTVLKEVASLLVSVHKCWIFVDGAEGEPVVRVFDPTWVLNWRFDGDTLVEAMLVELVDTAPSLDAGGEERVQKRFLHLHTGGWQRYKVVGNEKSQARKAVEDGEPGTWAYEDRHGKPTIPLFRAHLPLRRPLGYIMARKSNAIFNKESERDHLLRVANFPILNVMGGDSPYEAVVEALKKGARVLKNKPGESPHSFTSPDTGPASTSTEVLTRKVEEFYITGFKEYGDAGVEKTATEVRADINSGVAAFLMLLKSGVDDAENRSFWFIEQQQYPKDRNKWGVANVERSDEFLPIDVDQAIDRMRVRYFGNEQIVPIGMEGQLQVLREIAEWDGVKFNEDQARVAIAVQNMMRLMAVSGALPVPAEAKAKFTIDLLVTLGYVGAEDQVQMDDGSMKPTVEYLYEQALELAQNMQESARLATQPLPFE